MINLIICLRDNLRKVEKEHCYNDGETIALKHNRQRNHGSCEIGFSTYSIKIKNLDIIKFKVQEIYKLTFWII